MNTLTQLLVKHTFWEQVQYEFRDLVDMFKDFFLMIKEVTYDVVAGAIGGTTLNVILVVIGALVIMIACMAIINR
jgi:hypothetical protein